MRDHDQLAIWNLFTYVPDGQLHVYRFGAGIQDGRLFLVQWMTIQDGGLNIDSIHYTRRSICVLRPLVEKP